MKDLVLKLARALNRLAETMPDNQRELDAAKNEAAIAMKELSEFKAKTQADKDAQALSPDEQAEVDRALTAIADATPSEG